jgi:hypothetical protein
MQPMWSRHNTFWRVRLRPRSLFCSAVHGFRSVHRSRSSVSQSLVLSIQTREDMGHGYIGDSQHCSLAEE